MDTKHQRQQVNSTCYAGNIVGDGQLEVRLTPQLPLTGTARTNFSLANQSKAEHSWPVDSLQEKYLSLSPLSSPKICGLSSISHNYIDFTFKQVLGCGTLF